MGLPWKRPDNVPFPQVWLTFKAKDLNSDELVEYRVQDLPLDRYEDAIDHMCAQFIADQPLCKSLGLLNDEHSVLEEARVIYNVILKQNIALVCFKESSDEIVGLNMVAIKLTGEPEVKYVSSSEKLNTIYRANDICKKKFNPFEHYNVDKIMFHYGLSVHTKYRGRGIGEYILRARIPLGKAIGVSLTSGGFSAIASQKLAARAGFECNIEMTYDDIAKVDPTCMFPGIETKSMKIMSLKI